jgi:hypothetical protein
MSKKGIWLALAAGLLALAFAIPAGSTAAPAAKGGKGCKTFKVLHNDRVGGVVLPAGTYAIKGRRGLNCRKTIALFSRFLQDYDGVLPHQWVAISQGRGKALFHRPGKQFRVKRLSNPPAGNTVGGSLGHLCKGNFHVLHNDRIGPLFFPAGVYQIFIPRHSVLPCRTASNLFARFLTEPSGVLPGKWQMKSNRAVFFRKNLPARRRFRVDPGT